MEIAKGSLALMGTINHIQLEHPRPQPILAEVMRRLHQYNQRFSANDPNSELAKVNQQAGRAPVQVHPQLYQLIELGKFHSTLPRSPLNIAIGPLVQLWRIGFDDGQVPTPAAIRQALTLTNPDKICLNPCDNSVYLSEAGMKLDLGCLAKGYIADLLRDYLVRCQVKSALINLGGNIVVLGAPPTSKEPMWRIGIQDGTKARNTPLLALKVRDQSVVTSGIYERHLEREGKVYHHLLDPLTGYPLTTEMSSVTIVSQTSVLGEIWTSHLFGTPLDQALAALDQTEGIEGVIITTKGSHFSAGIKESVLKITSA